MGTGKIAKSSTLLAAAIPLMKITCNTWRKIPHKKKEDRLLREPIFCHFILSKERVKEKGGTV
jgi:hypothetical protein